MKKQKQQESRVRLDPELYNNLKDLQQQLGFKSLTQLIEFLIDEYMKIQPTNFEEVQQQIPHDNFWANVINLLFQNGLIDTNMLLHATQTDPNTHNQLRRILLPQQSDTEINNMMMYQPTQQINVFQHQQNQQYMSLSSQQMNMQVNQVNQLNQMNQLNQLNQQQVNQINQFNQINQQQMNQNQININQMNDTTLSDQNCPCFNPQYTPCSQGLCYTFSNYIDETGHFHSEACCPKQN